MSDRFIQMPAWVMDHAGLTSDAKMAYLVMRDASRNDVSTISLRRIGERLRRGKAAARRFVRELEEAGCIEVLTPARSRDGGWSGRCPTYLLLTRAKNGTGQIPVEHETGTNAGTGTTNGTGVTPTGAENGTDRCQNELRTGATDGTQPIRNSLDCLSLRADPQKEPPKDEPSEELVDLISRCGLNGQATSEARYALNRLSGTPGADRRFVEWLRYVLSKPDVFEKPYDHALRMAARFERLPIGAG